MFDIVFVVLVYRNTEDLKDFFRSNQLPYTKTIVVNSYYDDESEASFKEIAEKNGADFLSVPNKGYGAGNNRGIEYALANYQFKYLVVSNADIIIEKLSIEALEKKGDVIIAPRILNLKNKNQNPSNPFAPHELSMRFWKYIFDNNSHSLLWLVYAWSRVKKTLFYLISPWHKRIFSAHGAFIIFPSLLLKKMVPIYNENMFLFVEEEHLGMLAAQKGIKTLYAPDIVIRHKEDGSMSVASVNQFERTKQSFLVYYEYWFANKCNE